MKPTELDQESPRDLLELPHTASHQKVGLNLQFASRTTTRDSQRSLVVTPRSIRAGRKHRYLSEGLPLQLHVSGNAAVAAAKGEIGMEKQSSTEQRLGLSPRYGF